MGGEGGSAAGCGSTPNAPLSDELARAEGCADCGRSQADHVQGEYVEDCAEYVAPECSMCHGLGFGVVFEGRGQTVLPCPSCGEGS